MSSEAGPSTPAKQHWAVADPNVLKTETYDKLFTRIVAYKNEIDCKQHDIDFLTSITWIMRDKEIQEGRQVGSITVKELLQKAACVSVTCPVSQESQWCILVQVTKFTPMNRFLDEVSVCVPRAAAANSITLISALAGWSYRPHSSEMELLLLGLIIDYLCGWH
jgi:hypothetical protein